MTIPTLTGSAHKMKIADFIKFSLDPQEAMERAALRAENGKIQFLMPIYLEGKCEEQKGDKKDLRSFAKDFV